MQWVLRQFVIVPVLVTATAMVVGTPLGCGARTDMLAPPGGSSGTGGSGGVSTQESSRGGSGGSRPGFGDSGSGGYVYAAGGSGGYFYATSGSGGYLYAASGSGGHGADGVGGSSVPSTGPLGVASGGYVTSGPWRGYAWTAADPLGSTISPNDFSGLGAGGKLCAKGFVVADPAYGGYAILGINVAQTQSGGASGVWATAGTSGLAYSLTTNIASPLRIQIQGAAGYPSEAWCVNLSGSSGKIPWTQFNQTCWDNIGSFYDGRTPIESVMFLVPGTNTTRVNYDFCVGSVGPL
jgi:hypothetical protein